MIFKSLVQFSLRQIEAKDFFQKKKDIQENLPEAAGWDRYNYRAITGIGKYCERVVFCAELKLDPRNIVPYSNLYHLVFLVIMLTNMLSQLLEFKLTLYNAADV